MVAYGSIHAACRKAAQGMDKTDDKINCITRMLWVLVVEDVCSTETNTMNFLGKLTLKLQLVEKSSLIIVRTAARWLDSEVPVSREGEPHF